MLDWLKGRVKEGSTWAGLGLLTLAVGELGKVKEAPAIADAVSQAGALAVAGQLTPMNGLMIVAGLAAMFLKDKANK